VRNNPIGLDTAWLNANLWPVDLIDPEGELMFRARVRVTALKQTDFIPSEGAVMTARFKIKLLEGKRIFYYDVNATGAEFVKRCERLKRESKDIEISEYLGFPSEAWKQDAVESALAQTAV
jgi:hypothetical protein